MDAPSFSWRRVVRFLAIGCGGFALVVILLFAIAAFGVYRNARIGAPATPPASFTDAGIALPRTDAADAPIATDDDPSIGPTEATITLVEFSDFECPFCREAFPIIRELMARYGDRVRFVYRDFPVASLHANATLAAEAGACAHAQGKFWPLHDKIFQNQSALGAADIKRYATATGIDRARFDACLDGREFAAEVDADLRDGIALGVRGTPTWFINGYKVEGVIPRASFFGLIEQLLALPQQ